MAVLGQLNDPHRKLILGGGKTISFGKWFFYFICIITMFTALKEFLSFMNSLYFTCHFTEERPETQ